jgi:hypothetical protein
MCQVRDSRMTYGGSGGMRSHAGDLSPGVARYSEVLRDYGDHETYRPLAYVQGECAKLASQLLAAGELRCELL